MRRWFVVPLLLLLFSAALPAWMQVEGRTNTAFIIDASGSMNAAFSGNTRLTVAKEALTSLIAELSPNINASLWAYGHRLSQADPAASCEDIEEIVPLAPFDAAAFTDAVTNLTAIGYTPITTSLQQAAETLPPGERNIVVLLSDGEETCGGDPCAVAGALAASGVDLQVNTIGLAVDAVTRAQLQCIADATGGTYFDADDPDTLTSSLIEAAAAETGTIRLVDEDGNRIDGLDFLATAADGTMVGGAGSAEAAPGDYAVTIQSNPPYETTATVVAGEVTEIVVVGNGTVEVVDEEGNVSLDHTVSLIQNGEVLTIATGSVQAQPGTYTARIDTAPPIEREVTVQAGETVQISLVADATVRAVDVDGTQRDDVLVSAYAVSEEGETYAAAASGEIRLQPGRYRVAIVTQPQIEQIVTVEGGDVVEIIVEQYGTIEAIDENGQVAVGILVYEAETDPNMGNSVAGNVGSVQVLPGTYRIILLTDPQVERDVVVRAGEIAQIPVGQ